QSTLFLPAGLSAVSGAAAVSIRTLSIVLTHMPLIQIREGIHVTGNSSGAGDEIYISGIPGLIYTDGSFEFRNVPPGLHNILRISGNTVTALPIFAGDRDLNIV